jgi:hypothetical protein
MDARLFANLIFAAMALGTVLIVSLTWMWSRRPRSTVSNKQLEEIAARLANLERSVDAIAVETERISEGQRFTTKLLSEKDPVRSIGQ